jgi:hypothetical protein
MQFKPFVRLVLLSVLAAGALAGPADSPLAEEPVAVTLLASPSDAGQCCTVRGDTNGDGMVMMTDFTFLIDYAFHGGTAPSCLENADANADGIVNVQDILIILRYSFGMGSPPVPCP